MSKLPDVPPKHICILRLSAIGDICHVLPVVRTLQHVWPDTKLTWIIGKLEYQLVGDIPGIEFIIFDKRMGLKAYLSLKASMRHRQFDVLLHMQMSLRASIASLLIPAKIKLGFDKTRANDLQWLFTNQHIPYKAKQHVLDSFFEFIEVLGIHQRIMQWNIPVSLDDSKSTKSMIPSKPYFIISPCSSMSYRNWSVSGYAAVANYLAQQYSFTVVLTGGPTSIEKQYGEKISELCEHNPINLIGQTDLKQLLTIINGAEAVIAPDSGPAHMATAVATPVIGLYACTNPERARPYNSKAYTINKYPEAVQAKFGKSVNDVPWGIRVRDAGTMERITVSDVNEKIDALLEKN